MKARDVEKLFGMPRRGRKVEDYYAGVHSQEGPHDKKYERGMAYCFGFKLKPGDVVCAILLRKSKGSGGAK